MTDDLRTRIVSALQLASGRQIGWRGLLDCIDLADAVIRELGLREELKYPGRFTFMPPQRRRYVTEWEPDA